MGKWSEQKKKERGFFFIFVPTFPSAASFEKEGGGERKGNFSGCFFGRSL